ERIVVQLVEAATALDENPLSVREPAGPERRDAAERQRNRIARAGRQKRKLRAAVGGYDEHALSVRRELAEQAVAEPDRRRTVRFPQENRMGSGFAAGLHEDDRAAVSGKVAQERAVEPGEIALLTAGGCDDQAGARALAGEQHLTGRRDVVQRHPARH